MWELLSWSMNFIFLNRNVYENSFVYIQSLQETVLRSSRTLSWCFESAFTLPGLIWREVCARSRPTSLRPEGNDVCLLCEQDV